MVKMAIFMLFITEYWYFVFIMMYYHWSLCIVHSEHGENKRF